MLNTDGDDIAALVVVAANDAGIDAVALLALLRAESDLNPRAERWGMLTAQARAAIEQQDEAALSAIISRAWPDISFGYSQRIVLFHDQGDRTATVANCLAVRNHVFSHPDEDIRAAAIRLRSGFRNSLDGSPLGAMIVYNAGSDQRNNPEWLARWSGNVASYQRALDWAEQFRR